VQNIGKVARAHGSLGIIIISGSGRANDVPNLDHLEVFIGDTVGYEKRQLEITDLSDVDTTTLTPVNGDVLTWDQTNLEWKPLAAAGGATHIFDLQDVTIGIPGSLQNGSVLQWNSSTNEFAPATIQTGATILDQLADVTILSTPQQGQVLQYDSFANDFRPATLPPVPFILNDLQDVQITSTPNHGEALVYDSGFNAFRPQPVGGGGGSLDQVANDVSYFDAFAQYSRTPNTGDVLQWTYNTQANANEWLLVPGYTLGGGTLDTSTDVSYLDYFSQQPRQPSPGDVLQWNYNSLANANEWLLVPSYTLGGGGTLDTSSDVSYFDALSQQPRSPAGGDVLQWNYNSQTNANEWLLVPAYTLGGGGGPLDTMQDVSYIDISTQQSRSPAPGDNLVWGYNAQTGSYEWILEAGSGGADTLDDVVQRGATTTTTAVIPFLYSNQASFPPASLFHGAMAHSHADGAMYFAHSGSWVELSNRDDVDTELGDISTALTAILGS
jgi:hypothetical protein